MNQKMKYPHPKAIDLLIATTSIIFYAAHDRTILHLVDREKGTWMEETSKEEVLFHIYNLYTLHHILI